MKLVFATHNKNKAMEIQSLMPEGIEVLTLDDIGCMEDIPETADTLEGNAKIKADFVYENYGLNCFADDTGLEVVALNNEPGVLSARYAGSAKDPEQNMQLLLEKLSNQNNRSAQFRTAIALRLDGETYLFQGIVRGEITSEKKGNDGFGYDPIFQPIDSQRTFAEMNLAEKNGMSHRARALSKMLDFLNEKISR
ncbi:MAG: non-canonical purine NTP diphosphatase [Flavobacteriia bacterium]|jgi:XTP/dITP diphosphohydrolase